MDLSEEQIDQWEAWFRNLPEAEKLKRPPGFYALTHMARKYLKQRGDIHHEGDR